MGVSCWTICRNCDEEAPELGDGGFMGYPSLDEKVPDIDVPTFGSIYNGLASVHVITDEVDAFHRFLERHKGHEIVTETEDGPAFGGDDEMDAEDGDWGEEELGSGEELDEDEEILDDDEDFDDEDLDEDDEPPSDRYLQARYKASCSRCSASFETEETYGFVPFEPVTLAAGDIKAFQKKVVSVIDEASYRAEPLYDDDLDELAAFFKKHEKHGIQAELVEES